MGISCPHSKGGIKKSQDGGTQASPWYSKNVMPASYFWTLLLSVVLFAAILLGDARQSVVDVFMAGTVMAGCFALWKAAAFRRLPATAIFLWSGTLIAAAPFFWPDSTGPAVQNFIRYLFGYVVFGLLYAVATRGVAVLLERALLVVGVAVSVLTVLFLFIPHPPWLPLMNLLYPSYGHNHAADILLFIVPVVFYSKELSGRWRAAFWFIVLCGLIFSFARGAWILVALFGVATLIRANTKKKRWLLLSIVFASVFVFASVATASRWTKYISGGLVDAPAIRRVINKGSLFRDPRFEYWTQAYKMIRERPVFGSGPGSFYFGSRRLQSQPSSFSWFAHSHVLQLLAEQGIVGALPALALFGWTLVYVVRFVRRTSPDHEPAARLGMGVLLSAAYSFIEFNLSFAVVWALFWAMAGLILGVQSRTEPKSNNSRQFIVPLFILITFYTLFIAQSAALVLFPKRADLAFYLTPFDVVTARYYLVSATVTPEGIILVEKLHKTDPETLEVVASAWQKLGFMDASIGVRKRMLVLDPLNEENHKEYLGQLIGTARFEEAADWFVQYPVLFFPVTTDKSTIAVPASFIQEHPQEYKKLFDSKYSHEVRYSRFYYNLGLWYLSTESKKTRRLWELASRLQPKLSYLWLERMFLEQQELGDYQSAEAIYTGCLHSLSAAKHCREVWGTGQVLPPGYYKSVINEK